MRFADIHMLQYVYHFSSQKPYSIILIIIIIPYFLEIIRIHFMKAKNYDVQLMKRLLQFSKGSVNIKTRTFTRIYLSVRGINLTNV